MANKIKNKTKGLIALTVYYLMFKKDYEEISVKEICEKAGISRMSFYRYYSKKDDIFVDYCDDRFEEFYNEVHSAPDITLKEFTYKMFAFIQKYKRQIKVLRKANREFMLLDQLNSYAKYIISSTQSNYLKEQKNNPIFASFMAGGLFNVIKFWIDGNMSTTPEQMNEMLYSIVDREALVD